MGRWGTWLRTVTTVLLLPTLGIGGFFALIVTALLGVPHSTDGIGLWGWVPLAVVGAVTLAISWAARPAPEPVRVALCAPALVASLWGGYILLALG